MWIKDVLYDEKSWFLNGTHLDIFTSDMEEKKSFVDVMGAVIFGGTIDAITLDDKQKLDDWEQVINRQFYLMQKFKEIMSEFLPAGR